MFYPSQTDFTAIYDSGTPQVVYGKFVADGVTPVCALAALAHMSAEHILLESVQGGRTRGRYSVIALMPDMMWRVTAGGVVETSHAPDLHSWTREGGDVLGNLRAHLQQLSRFVVPEELPPMSCAMFGYMGYDMVRYVEKLPDSNPDTIGIPEALYMRPKLVLVFDSVHDSLYICALCVPREGVDAASAYEEACGLIDQAASALRNPPRLGLPIIAQEEDIVPRSHVSKERFCDMVARAREYTLAGDIFQVVPSRRFSGGFTHAPLSLYRALRHLNPSPYLFYASFGGFAITGSSPEILVRKEGEAVTIRPLAGTRRRGADKTEDEALAAELLADPKELAEHLMLLDLGRNDVGRVCKSGTVRVTEQMVIEYYSHVMHIVSNVEGRIQDEHDAIDALMAGFPAGTLSGAPKIRAMEIIDELEDERRSFYGGTMGYFTANGDMDSCIMLRTALVKDDRVVLQAGGGVVEGSREEDEYAETENKAGALIQAIKIAKHFT